MTPQPESDPVGVNSSGLHSMYQKYRRQIALTSDPKACKQDLFGAIGSPRTGKKYVKKVHLACRLLQRLLAGPYFRLRPASRLCKPLVSASFVVTGSLLEGPVVTPLGLGVCVCEYT